MDMDGEETITNAPEEVWSKLRSETVAFTPDVVDGEMSLVARDIADLIPAAVS